MESEYQNKDQNTCPICGGIYTYRRVYTTNELHKDGIELSHLPGENVCLGTDLRDIPKLGVFFHQ